MRSLLVCSVFMILCTIAFSQSVVVKFNYNLLNYEFMDGDKVHFQLHEAFSDEGTRILDSVELLIPGIKECSAQKIFPFLHTSDSISISRTGRKVTIPPFWAALRITLDESMDLRKTIITLDRAVELTEYAHYDFPVFFQDVPNDEFYGSRQEALFDPFEQADINIEGAWDIETGEPFVKIGVHDTGIDSLHPDLLPLYGNGYYYIDNQTPPHWGTDEEGHGTSVAGIISAHRNNGIGIAGVAGGDSLEMGCTLVDVKYPFFSYSGSSYILAGVVNGAIAVGNFWEYPEVYLDVAYNNDSYFSTAPGLGLNIGNHSYVIKTEIPVQNDDDGKTENDPGMNILQFSNCNLCREAYLFSLENGVINVVARGNSATISPATDPSIIEQHYPQRFDDNWIICVGASGYDGITVQNGVNQGSSAEIASNYFSLYGAGMDLIAPGSDTIVYTTKSTILTPFNTDYKSFNGTSAAAPHVAGVVGLLLSHYNKGCYNKRNLSIEDVEYILENSATDLLTPGYDEVTGWGRLNGTEALKMIENPTKQIVHPDSLISSTIVQRDTIALGYNRAFVGDGWGPISRNIPLKRGQEYEVERVLVQNRYSFDEYITPATQVIDIWERPSVSNSTQFYRDTFSYQGIIPPFVQVTKYNFDFFQKTPFDSIVSIDLINNEVTVEGYYYHFMGEYKEIQNEGNLAWYHPEGVVVDPDFPVDVWYPVNPIVDTARMGFSIYIHDSTLTELYDFPCDSMYLSFMDSTEHEFNVSGMNENVQEQIRIYPNPFTGEFTVHLPHVEGQEVLILYDVKGEEIQRFTPVKKELTIQTKELETGLYILTYSTKQGIHTLKLLKQ